MNLRQRLALEAQRGSWKFEVRDDHEQAAYKAYTIFPGDGVDDLDQLLAWMDRHPAGEVDLVTAENGHDAVTRADVLDFRQFFVDFYGEVPKINEYPPLPDA